MYYNASGQEEENLNELCRKIGKDSFYHERGDIIVTDAYIVTDLGNHAQLSNRAIWDIEESATIWKELYERHSFSYKEKEKDWIGKDVRQLTEATAFKPWYTPQQMRKFYNITADASGKPYNIGN